MNNEPDIDLSGSDGTTLTEVLDGYAEGGFSAQFSVTDDARIECAACSTVSDPASVKMSSLRRLEGESDPDDMMAVVAVTCPACQTRGTLTLGYGPSSTSQDADVLVALRDHRHDQKAPGNSAPGETTGDTGTR
ncbi:MAG: hypothetical protein JWN99_634 [Ilumatobacteraceae bacterium]|nr:hypothetical protein [Ilumatobacteraceae bacterium]